MKLHEYQSKDLFAKVGIPIPIGQVIHSPDEVAGALSKVKAETGEDGWVLKAQVHSGGRGKAGGIRLVSTVDEATEGALKMIGSKLMTHQSGSEGILIKKLLVEQKCEIKKEFYVGITMDRSRSCPVIMVSEEGGVEIEELAAKRKGAIIQYAINPMLGLQPFEARALAVEIGCKEKQIMKVADILTRCYQLFIETDASLVEINPLVLTESGNFLALDAKVSLDDNALFRHEDLAELRDVEEEDPKELEALSWGLSYASLDGDIGCMVNGAGLAMATMDIIKYFGGEPANFLDVGGSASSEMVAHALKIILSDEKVKAILINIFGGIMKCDVLAQGLVEGASEIEIKVPLVVRLEGTHVEEGRKILENSDLNIISVNGLKEAAQKVTAAARGEA